MSICSARAGTSALAVGAPPLLPTRAWGSNGTKSGGRPRLASPGRPAPQRCSAGARGSVALLSAAARRRILPGWTARLVAWAARPPRPGTTSPAVTVEHGLGDAEDEQGDQDQQGQPSGGRVAVSRRAAPHRRTCCAVRDHEHGDGNAQQAELGQHVDEEVVSVGQRIARPGRRCPWRRRWGASRLHGCSHTAPQPEPRNGASVQGDLDGGAPEGRPTRDSVDSSLPRTTSTSSRPAPATAGRRRPTRAGRGVGPAQQRPREHDAVEASSMLRAVRKPVPDWRR